MPKPRLFVRLFGLVAGVILYVNCTRHIEGIRERVAYSGVQQTLTTIHSSSPDDVDRQFFKLFGTLVSLLYPNVVSSR